MQLYNQFKLIETLNYPLLKDEIQVCGGVGFMPRKWMVAGLNLTVAIV